jgi:hypothetical protein
MKRLLISVLMLAATTACIPYTVGSTAQTVPPEQKVVTMSGYFIPGGLDPYRDSSSTPWFGLDPEMRLGISEGIDVGVRLPSFSGIVVNVKRRLGGLDDSSAAIAIMPGIGIVNLGLHAAGELTLIASSRPRNATFYGGLHVVQVIPISRGAVTDSPTAGGFFGVRLGHEEFGVSPEIGVFYDKSALGLRTRNVIVVPSVTLHGERLISALTGMFGGR